MPDMNEIYQKHADRYEELVCAEDFENNLGHTLHELLDWNGQSVIEAGVGTGRVTKLYIECASSSLCCDRSPHMLDYARSALASYTEKLTFQQSENTCLPKLERTLEVFIEGWSFGHTAMECPEVAEVSRVTDILIYNATKNLKSSGTVFIIETLGTNTDSPTPPDEKLARFYQELERRYDFRQHVIRTDFQFPDNQEAARVMGFFFGNEMKRSVLRRGTSTIPEWTGIWMKRT